MKIENITPRFLISKDLRNSVICTEDIVSIKLGDIAGPVVAIITITFRLRNFSDTETWKHVFSDENIKLADKEYRDILESLNKTLITS